MKTKLEINVLQSLALVIQEKTQYEVDSGNMDLFLSITPHFLAINQINFIRNKDIPKTKRQELLEPYRTKEVFEQFGVVVTVCKHVQYPFESNFHLTYLSLYPNSQSTTN